ncbi:MAG: T9SS type A sorting domain-containing protein, partial [Bacteroidetes bacterium]|nr:T9SS type A sorting domain-containing protein [Bacteroidota bacterium]MBM3456353.1 T9SS type A sorting domain-containing protein [Bacteroidota bacterium]
FDFFGKSMVQFDSITNNAQIDLGRFASGNYILQAKFATGTVQRKISIH